VSATNAKLAERVADKSFREDLYYRLAVVELTVPPLRERKDELVELAVCFAAEAARRARRPVPALDDAGKLSLLSHDWPGNVRELRNRIERAVALTDAAVISKADLFPERRLEEPGPATLANARERAELDQIDRALALSGGRVSEAARHLGISRTTLWKRKRQKDGA
jgi:DNA-binding NtrC family response regulator